MMERIGASILAALCGAGVFLLAAIISGPPSTSLLRAQQDYAQCLHLQAPQDVCLKAYLLPKETAH